MINKFKLSLSAIENQLVHEDWEVRSKGLRAVTALCNDFSTLPEFSQNTKKLEVLLDFVLAILHLGPFVALVVRLEIDDHQRLLCRYHFNICYLWKSVRRLW
jgi:hypothetical protein